MKLLNLTPHDLQIVGKNGDVITIPASGQVARVSSRLSRLGEVEGIEIFSQTYGQVVGLPEPREDTYCIVSRLVAAAAPSGYRTNLLVPGELLRDEQGRVIGARGLVLQ